MSCLLAVTRTMANSTRITPNRPRSAELQHRPLAPRHGFRGRVSRGARVVPRVWKGRENVFVCPETEADRERARNSPFRSSDEKQTFFYQLGEIYSGEELEILREDSIALVVSCMAEGNPTLNDWERKVYAVVANVLDIVCNVEDHKFELELTSPSACTLFNIALVEALKASGVDSAELKLGYYVSYDYPSQSKEAAYHAWVEVDGSVIDIANDSIGLLEAAKAKEIPDHTDKIAMGDTLGTVVFPYLSEAKLESGRGLVVMDQKVFVGYSPSYRVFFSPVTELTPPHSVRGASHASEIVEKWAEALNEKPTIKQLVETYKISPELENILGKISSLSL